MFQSLSEGPSHDPIDDEMELTEISQSMREAETGTASVDNPRIPSGYVYLGQFIDHDLTFDPISQLQRRNDPEALINFRTPRFDLDSVYGSGPVDEPFQYDQSKHDGFALLVEESNGPDLPRNRQDRALIGDPRNDENGFVSQLHVAFLKLHNRLLDDVSVAEPGLSPVSRFEKAQSLAQWHFQWVVAHDFLRRTIGDTMHSSILRQVAEDDGTFRESIRLNLYRHKKNPYLPVEFSVAAYRFGHSQVRDDYSINQTFHRRLFDVGGDDFRGFAALRPGWHASWPFFFEIDGTPPQFSKSIDSNLASSLINLQGESGPGGDLALRNLKRGAAMGLPFGQDVAKAMGVVPLAQSDLEPAQPDRAPLWFYILREAQVIASGEHLGPVGGRIVGETLLGLLRADPQSYYAKDPKWLPTLPFRRPTAASFDMVDLLAYAVPDQVVRF